MDIQDWFVAISIFATLLMAFAIFWSLRQSKEQVSELKRQWYELNREKVVPFLIRKENKVFFLRIKNISNVSTSNILLTIKINSVNDEIDVHENSEIKINGSTFTIEPNGFKDMIVSQYWREIDYKGSIDVDIKYTKNNTSEHHKISLSELNVVEAYSDIDIITLGIRSIANEIRDKKFM